FADLVLNCLEDSLGRFDAGPGGRADMELDLTAVDDRKEVAALQHQNCGAEPEHQEDDDRNDCFSMQQKTEKRHIAVAHALEAPLEGGVKAGEPSGCRTVLSVMLALEQQADRDRR